MVPEAREQTVELPSDELPERIGSYRLIRLLAEGGMGAVYEAEHVGLGSVAALKLIAERTGADPALHERLMREARATAAIDHPNVVRVFHVGEEEGRPYLVMELLDGETLHAVLQRRGRLAPPVAVAVAAAMLDGLGAAHRRGIVHRDVKPSNVFLARRGDGSIGLKLLDFGIAKSQAERAGLTRDDMIVGTPLYMAPEQWMDAAHVDPRADLYAVGVTLYRCLCGEPPYESARGAELFARVHRGNATPLHVRMPELPAELVAVVGRAMAVEPDERFTDAERFREALLGAVPAGRSAALPTALPGPSVRGSLPPLAFASPEDAPPVSRSTTRALRREAGAVEGDGGAGGARSVAKPTSSGDASSTVDGAPAEPPPPGPVEGEGPARAPRPRRAPTHLLLGLCAGVLGVGAFALGDGADDPQLGPPAALAPSAPVAPSPSRPALRYGVADYADEETVRAAHAPLATHLAARLGRPVELVIVPSHALPEQLARGELALAPLSAVRFLRARALDPEVRPLATAEMGGGTTHEALIVTRLDAAVEQLTDLRGHTFCFVDSASTSGYVYPRALFRRVGVDPDEDFRAIRFTGDHANSLRLLDEGICDGAAVYRNLLMAPPEGIEPGRFRIVGSTARIPNDAYTVASSVDPETAAALSEILLALTAEEAERVLEASDVRGFAPPDPDAYAGAAALLE